MARLRVCSFGLSADGYGAAPDQGPKHPGGVGGEAVHQWFFPTRTFQHRHGGQGGATGVDDDFAAAGFEGVGAWIIGRNMFGPERGPWDDPTWRGWWGDNPPFHTPVFVLTHHPRDPVAMEGGTVFHFVTDGAGVALERAKEAAKGEDVRLGGGVETIRQYLRAGLIDELHLAVAPTLLGAGELLFSGLDAVKLGYQVSRSVITPNAMHLIVTRSDIDLHNAIS
jgi:dihydrofolate reductase